MIWSIPLILVCMLLAFALAYYLLSKRYPQDSQTLVETIDQLLPQTQCAQCGYPGCRPYAEAVVAGEALDLCPPGGAPVYDALKALMGEQTPSAAPSPNKDMIAVIDESQCIGCTLCLPPCPVDAIVGATNQMHTVIQSECTGCELCVPACPVDCIVMEELPARPHTPNNKRRRTTEVLASPNGCINCGQCNPVCPVGLPAQELLYSTKHEALDQALQLGLNRCIECGLCDRSCPSEIPMADLFHQAKRQIATQQRETERKTHYKDRFLAHNERAAAALVAAADKRAARLKKAARWS